MDGSSILVMCWEVFTTLCKGLQLRAEQRLARRWWSHSGYCTVCTIAENKGGAESDGLSWELCIPWFTATRNVTMNERKKDSEQFFLANWPVQNKSRELIKKSITDPYCAQAPPLPYMDVENCCHPTMHCTSQFVSSLFQVCFIQHLLMYLTNVKQYYLGDYNIVCYTNLN